MPLPVISELPQCARLLISQRTSSQLTEVLTIDRFIDGLIEMVCPVQASNALPASIQSVVPSRLTVVMEVLDAFVDISAVRGVVDDIF